MTARSLVLVAALAVFLCSPVFAAGEETGRPSAPAAGEQNMKAPGPAAEEQKVEPAPPASGGEYKFEPSEI